MALTVETPASQIDSVGRRILEARKARGLTQQELAVECGVTRQQIIGWEKNHHTPNASSRIKLEECLRLPPGHLDPPPQDELVERLESVLAEAQFLLRELKRGES